MMKPAVLLTIMAMSVSLWMGQQSPAPAHGRPELVLQTGVTVPAANVVFSPDGRLLASMSFYGGSIELWETASGRELYTINLGERSAITSAMNSAFGFTPDGSSLVSVSAGTIKLWDARTGKLQKTHAVGAGRDFGMAFLSSDASRAVTLSESRKHVNVWDTSSGQAVKNQSLGEDQYVDAVALSADGRLLATSEEQRDKADIERVIVIRDVATFRQLQSIKLKQTGKTRVGETVQPVRSLRFAPDGKMIGMAFRDVLFAYSANMNSMGVSNGIEIRWWDAGTGSEARSVNVAAGGSSTGDMMFAEHTFAWSPDGKVVATTTFGDDVKLFDATSGAGIVSIRAHSGSPVALAFAADSTQLATTGTDRTIKIWDVKNASQGGAQLVTTFGGSALPISSASFSGDGRTISTSAASAVNIWDLPSGSSARSIELTPRIVRNVADAVEIQHSSQLSAGGQYAYAKTSDGGLKVWEARTGREVKALANQPGLKIGYAELSRDGKLLVVPEGRDRLNPGASSAGATTSSSQPATQPAPQATPPQNQKPSDPKKQAKDARKQMEEMMKSGGFGGLAGGGRGISKDDIAQMQKMAEEMQKAAQSGDFGKMQEMSAKVMGSIGMPTTAVGGAKERIRLVDLSTNSTPREVAVSKGLIGVTNPTVAINPSATLLAYSSGSPTIRLLDVASGSEIGSVTPSRAMQVGKFAFSSDGKILAASVMEAKAGVTMDSFGNDASFLANFNYAVRLWDVSDPKAPRDLRALSGPSATLNAIVFSPDGTLVAAGGLDSVVRVWEVSSGREIQKLSGHALAINTVDFSPDGKMLVSGSEDGSSRIWDLATAEVLLTLVTLNGGRDWLAVTPEGLFDGTPDAWNQILWRFSSSIFDVTPVEVFFTEFYSPGLVSQIYAGQRPRAAQDVSQKDRRQPVVALSGAGEGTETSQRSLAVRVDVREAAAGAGARDVRLFRNGTLVKAWRGDVLKGAGPQVLEATVPVVAGDNRITAYAFNRDNVKSVDAVLNVKGAASLKRDGTVYILAVGVNQYANDQYNLKYAVADATSFTDEIKAQQLKLGQYSKAEVVSLSDSQATKANILAALAQFKTAQPEDAVILYFAGHGTAKGARFYLVPHDLGYSGPRAGIDAKAVETILEHSISDLEIEAAVEGIDVERFLFVLDACNSGQALEAEEKRRGPMNSKGLAQLAYEKGMYILTAAQSYQAALEAAQLGHGYLTYALVEEGLKQGKADRDLKDGQVIAREWFNYATDRVPQMQEKVMTERLLLFVEGDDKIKDPSKRNIQRPRVFYRRELEARPMVIAKQ